MKLPFFGKLTAQKLDIPKKIRVSLYVAAAQFDSEFDRPSIDNRLLKATTSHNFDKKLRSHFLQTKTSSLLTFELEPAAAVIKQLETFLQFLQVEPAVEDTFLQAQYMVEVTAVQEMSEFDSPVTALELVGFAAALLAAETKGIVIEPYSLKILSQPREFAQLLNLQAGLPPLCPFLTVVQSHNQFHDQSHDHTQVRTTSHGLTRIGLPEIEIKFTDVELAPATAIFTAALAQSIFEDVVLAKAKSPELEQYDFSTIGDNGQLTVNRGHVERAHGGEIQNIGSGGGSARVPLKLSRGALDLNINLALHGRHTDKNAALAEILKDLNLL